MNRRSFFRKLAGAAASVAVATSIECFGFKEALELPKLGYWKACLMAAYKPHEWNGAYKIVVRKLS